MSEQELPRSVEQRIVIKFLVGENVPSAEIHHRLQQQYGESQLHWNLAVTDVQGLYAVRNNRILLIRKQFDWIPLYSIWSE